MSTRTAGSCELNGTRRAVIPAFARRRPLPPAISGRRTLPPTSSGQEGSRDSRWTLEDEDPFPGSCRRLQLRDAVLLSSTSWLCFRTLRSSRSYDRHRQKCLPAAKSTKYALRVLGHSLSLEQVFSELHKTTFINRIIFTDNFTDNITVLCTFSSSLHVIFRISFYFHFYIHCLFVYHAFDVIFFT